MTIDGPTAIIIGAVLGSLIVGGVALMMWGINTLVKINDRLTRLELGQTRLVEDQGKLAENQAQLQASLTKVAEVQAQLQAGLTKLTDNQAQLQAGQNEILRRLDILSA